MDVTAEGLLQSLLWENEIFFTRKPKTELKYNNFLKRY